MPASRPRISCPFCSYDLSGEIETWDDACPIRTPCPECGSSLVWGDLLGERSLILTLRRVPGLPAGITRWVVEAVALTIPRSFSRLSETEQALVMRRWPWKSVIALLLAHLLACYLLAVMVLVPELRDAAFYGTYWRELLPLLKGVWPYASMQDTTGFPKPLAAWVVFAILWSVMIPAAAFMPYEIIPGTGPRRLLRRWLCTFIPLPIVIAFAQGVGVIAIHVYQILNGMRAGSMIGISDSPYIPFAQLTIVGAWFAMAWDLTICDGTRASFIRLLPRATLLCIASVVALFMLLGALILVTSGTGLSELLFEWLRM